MNQKFNAPLGDFFNTDPDQKEKRNSNQNQNMDIKTNSHADTDIKYKQDKSSLEVKTKRLNLVMQPTTLEHARERAQELNLSVNEYLHRLIKNDYKKKILK